MLDFLILKFYNPTCCSLENLTTHRIPNLALRSYRIFGKYLSNISVQKKTKEKHFVKKPIYPGGNKALREFVSKEMKYPKLALENKIEGIVYLKYEIDHKGQVVGSKVLSSVGHGCDEEAQRIVAKLKFEVPKNPRKMRVTFHKTIKIKFKLSKKVQTKAPEKPKTKKQVVQQRLTYTITPTVSKQSEKQSEKKSGYSYTIKY